MSTPAALDRLQSRTEPMRDWESNFKALVVTLKKHANDEYDATKALKEIRELVDTGRQYVLFASLFEDNSNKLAQSFNAVLQSRDPRIIKACTECISHLAQVMRESFKEAARTLLTNLINVASYVGDDSIAENGASCVNAVMMHCPSSRSLKECMKLLKMTANDTQAKLCTKAIRSAVLNWPMNRLEANLREVATSVKRSIKHDDKGVQTQGTFAYWALVDRVPSIKKELDQGLDEELLKKVEKGEARAKRQNKKQLKTIQRQIDRDLADQEERKKELVDAGVLPVAGGVDAEDAEDADDDKEDKEDKEDKKETAAAAAADPNAPPPLPPTDSTAESKEEKEPVTPASAAAPPLTSGASTQSVVSSASSNVLGGIALSPGGDVVTSEAAGRRIKELEERLAKMEAIMTQSAAAAAVGADDDDDILEPDSEDEKEDAELYEADAKGKGKLQHQASESHVVSKAAERIAERQKKAKASPAERKALRKKRKALRKKEEEQDQKELEEQLGRDAAEDGQKRLTKDLKKKYTDRLKEFIELFSTSTISDDDQWKVRHKALDDLTSLVVEGVQYRDFGEKVWAALNKELSKALINQVEDLRGEIIRQCSACFATIAKTLGQSFKGVAKNLIPRLVQVASAPNAVTRRVIMPCVQAVVEYCPAKSTLKYIFEQMKVTKSKFTVVACVHALHAAVEHWPLRGKFWPQIKDFQKAIASGLTAAAPEARAVSVVAFWSLIAKVPEIEEKFHGSLDKRTQIFVDKARPEHMKAEAESSTSDSSSSDEEEEKVKKKAKKPPRRLKTNKTFGKEWPKAMDGVLEIIETNDANFAKRIASLEELESIVTDGVGFSRKFASQFDSKFSVYLGKALIIQLSDTRADVLKAACSAVDTCSKQLGLQFKNLALTILPSLIAVAASPNKMLRSYGDQTLMSVVENTPSKQYLPVFHDTIEGSKNKKVHIVVMDAARLALEKWPLAEKLTSERSMIGLIIKAGICSSHAEARALAVSAFKRYARRDEEIYSFMQGVGLEQRQWKLLEEAMPQKAAPSGDDGDSKAADAKAEDAAADDAGGEEESSAVKKKGKPRSRRAARRQSMAAWITAQKQNAARDKLDEVQVAVAE